MTVGYSKKHFSITTSVVHAVGFLWLFLSLSRSSQSLVRFVNAGKNELLAGNISAKCSLERQQVELLKFVIPDSYVATASRSRYHNDCTDFAFFFMKRIHEIETARTFKIDSYIGGGLSGLVISLESGEGVVSSILKIVLLDSSKVSNVTAIPYEFSTSKVNFNYFVREYSNQKLLYEKYSIRIYSNLPNSKNLPFKIYDVFALSNYTIIKKGIGKLDIAYCQAEIIPSEFTSKFFDWLSFPRENWDLKVFLHLYFRSLISLYTEFGFIHGDIHFGNVMYNPKYSPQIIIFDFERSIFIESVSHHERIALLIRDFYIALVYLTEYYPPKWISIPQATEMINLYCELSHLYIDGIINKYHKNLYARGDHSSLERKDRRVVGIINNALNAFSRSNISVHEYDDIKVQRDRAYEELDSVFYRVLRI